jgi:hypothetical protein
LCSDAFDATRHFGGSTAGKREQEDTSRISPVKDQVRNPMGQRVGLAGTCTGDDQQRTRVSISWAAIFDGTSLLCVEFGHRRHWAPHESRQPRVSAFLSPEA